MSIAVRLVDGQGQEPMRAFTPGTPVGPFSVGSQAEWALSSPTTAPLHAYLYYDGTALFVAAAQGEVATTVNGSDVGTDWTPVAAPGEIRMGGVWLSVADGSLDPALIEDVATAFYQGPALTDDEPTRAPAPPAARRSGPSARPGPPKPQADAESTAFLPIEQMRKPGPAGASGAYPAQAGPGAPMGVPGGIDPSTGQPFGQPFGMHGQPGMQGQPGMHGQPGMQGQAPLFSGPNPFPFPQGTAPAGQGPGGPGGPMPMGGPGVPGGGPAPAQGAWKSASPARKALYVLMPIALVAFAVSMFDEPAAPPKGATKAAASGSAKGKGAPAGSASAGGGPGAAGAAPGAASSPAASSTGALLPAASRPPYTPPSPYARVPKEVEKTLERRAVDAVAAGNFPEATKLYEQLARENPDVPAYPEAVRILKAKSQQK
jgi:hypothetical protein